MDATSPTAAILETAATWPGVTIRPTPRGASAIVFEDHELGHVHSDRGTLDLPLPPDRRAQVLQARQAREWFSNWVSKPIATDVDARDGLALLRENYDALHAWAASEAPGAQ